MSVRHMFCSAGASVVPSRTENCPTISTVNMEVSRLYHEDECFRYYNFGHECSPEVYTTVGRFTCVDVSDVMVIPELVVCCLL